MKMENKKKFKKCETRFDPFAGIVAQSTRRAEGFDARKHRAIGVGTHISTREAGNAPLAGDRDYEKTLQQKPVKQPKGDSHKEINHFVDRKGILYREVKFFDKEGNVVSTKLSRVKKGKVPKEIKDMHEFAMEIQSTGGIASAPIGTKINIRKGDVSVSNNISGYDRQKLMDLAEKQEAKGTGKSWYSGFFGGLLKPKRIEPVAKEVEREPATAVANIKLKHTKRVQSQ